MVDTGLHWYGFPWREPTIKEVDDPRCVIDELAAGSKYDHDLEVGTGLFAPLTDEELKQLEDRK